MFPPEQSTENDGEDRGTIPTSPVGRQPTARRLASPLAAVLAGIALITGVAYADRQWRLGQVWSEALVAREGEPFWDDCIPIASRKIDADNFPPSALMQEIADTDYGKELIEQFSLDMREHIVAVDLPTEVWQSLTVSGRVPTPDTREVLAGPLCRLDSFTVDGEWFDVVGRLQPATSGFCFSYLTRSDGMGQRVFSEERGAFRGWIHPQGIRRLTDPSFKPDPSRKAILLPDYTPVPLGWSCLAGIGIALVMAGGGLVQIRVLRRINGSYPYFRALLDPIDTRPRLFASVHIACYGTFAAFTLLAYLFPIANLQLLSLLTGAFLEGELKQVGHAYLSGDVFAAAWATFVNNFYVQTLKLTILPSIVIPFWGFGKTLLSLAIAGFGLSPIWSNLLSRFTYHSITMSLEIEAYVLVVFAVCLYPLLVRRGLREATLGRGLVKGLAVMGPATILSAAMLALAAVYEAATVIVLEQLL